MEIKIWNSVQRERKIAENQNILKISALDYIDEYLAEPYKLCKKIAPKNIEEWKFAYRQNGQSLDELKKAAFRLYKKMQRELVDLNYEECFNILYHKAIYETFDEYKFNIKANRDMKKYGVKLWDYDKRTRISTSSRFKSTNWIYNRLGLNAIEKIGYCMKLIKESSPTSKIEWQQAYYDSGIEEKEFFRNNHKRLNDNKLGDLLANHGKSFAKLLFLAEKFKTGLNNNLPKNQKPYTLEECLNYIYIRAVDKTYIGYIREKIAYKFLNEFCKIKNLKLRDTDKDTDIKNCIDYELFKNNKLIAGIQVKGKAYEVAVQKNNSCIKRAENIRIGGHELYQEEKNVPIFWVYVDKNFNISNQEVLNEIRKSLSRGKSVER